MLSYRLLVLKWLHIPPNSCTTRVLSMDTNRENQQCYTEERYWSKNQGFQRIKQVSDRNRTKIESPKVTKINYNPVAQFITKLRIGTRYHI